MKKIKEIMRDVARSAASTYAFAALAIMSATTAVASLPAGYTQLAYIESSGTQYIDTGVVPQSNSRLVCDFQYTSLPASGGVAENGWCAAGKRDALLFGIRGGNFSASACSPGGGSIVFVSTGVPADVDRHTVDIQNSAMCFDGNSFATGTLGNTFTAKDNMYLFARHIGWSPGGADTHCSMRIYSCQIYAGDTLVRDFVPAVRDSDVAVGLYDTENDVFFTNRGTGAFTYGTINRFAISPIANCYYVSPDELAGGVEPEVRVYDYTTSSWLVLGRDYTVSYQDNTSRGAAKAVATGKGNYAGESAEVSFVIVCVKMVSADYSLSADEDWTNCDFVSIASGVTIDLNGHNMTISGLDGSGTVTDSVGGGELHCAIPASYLGGYQAAITDVTLKGKLTLVKEGPGVLTAIKERQAYTGGTVVNAGTLKYGCGNKSAFEAYPFGQILHKKDQGHITINAGGVLDPGGAQAWNCHTLIINGGMISNTVAGGNMTYGIFNPKTTVNGDFTFATLENYAWTVPDPSGHTVTVDIGVDKTFYVATSVNYPIITGGRMNVVRGGNLATFSDKPVDFHMFDLDCFNAALSLGGTMSVRDYGPQYNGNSGKGNVALDVYGTFTPASDYFYGPTMQNGSAIDLSAKTGAWSVTSLLTDGGNATTKFAAGATVTVILGERKCKVGDKVISWTTAPDSTVSFTSRKATFESRSDGLYITEWKGSGLSIFVR
jgi:hypothetical protein